MSGSEAHSGIDHDRLSIETDVASSHTGTYDENLESSNSPEFEFRMALPAENSGQLLSISPADDLFYKGQLLPLLLPSRRLMVEQISGLNEDSSSNSHGGTLSGNDTAKHMEDEFVPYVATEHQNRQYLGEVADQGGCSLPWALDRKSLSCSRRKKFQVSASTRNSNVPRLKDLENRSLRLENRSLRLYVEDPSVFPNCYMDPANLSTGERISALDSVTVVKGKMSPASCRQGAGGRWKVLFARLGTGRKCCSDADCCQSAKPRCLEQLGTSSSISPAPVVLSGLSCRNLSSERRPSLTCRPVDRTLESEKANHMADEDRMAATGLQKGRLVIKARDCLRRSFNYLKPATIALQENDSKASLQEQQVTDRLAEVQAELIKVDHATTTERAIAIVERSRPLVERSNKKWKYVNDALSSLESNCDTVIDMDSGVAFAMRARSLTGHHRPKISSRSGFNVEGFISLDPNRSGRCFELNEQDNSFISKRLGRPDRRKIVTHSSTPEFQSGIQGAIAHCKKSQGAGP